MKQVLEYIWLDGEGKFRSKTRVTENIDIFPEWSYDGSSTGQASDSGNTEIILNPVFHCLKHEGYYLVLCDTVNRQQALNIFNENLDAKPWFGLEQEFSSQLHQSTYYLINKNLKADSIAESDYAQLNEK